jgi:thymidylate synthase
MMTVNEVWLKLLSDLITDGHRSAPRGQGTSELLGYQTVLPMIEPVVTVATRKLGYRFLSAEAAWILSGDNRLASIVPYARHLAQFSDDDLTLAGAYGPPFIDQAGYVVDALLRDPATRQAVLTTWRPRPRASKDVPCTVALQWLVRADRLHCVTTMRSSDAWLGWPYDVHTFSAMSAHVLLALRTRDPSAWSTVQLGELRLTAGSQHLYDTNLVQAEACLRDPTPLAPWRPLPLGDLRGPADLVDLLWTCARG